MVKSQEAARLKHGQFHAQLEKAEDGFGIVAEYFGRGLFTQPPPLATQNQVQISHPYSGTPAPAPLQTEARMRADARQGAGIMMHQSEARLRAGEGRQVQ